MTCRYTARQLTVCPASDEDVLYASTPTWSPVPPPTGQPSQPFQQHQPHQHGQQQQHHYGQHGQQQQHHYGQHGQQQQHQYGGQQHQQHAKRRREEDEHEAPSFSSPSAWMNAGTTSAGDAGSTMQVSDVAKRLMKGAGWKEGQGLGKDEQGIVAPIQAEVREGRHGLGAEAEDKGFEYRQHTDIDIHRIVPHAQQVVYISADHAVAGPNDIPFNIKVGEARRVDIDYDMFASKDLVDRIFRAKSRFDNISETFFLPARTRANPYEKIGKSVFQNRAAVKMANLDVLFDLLKPVHPEQSQLVNFADVCAGPGGFSEYMLWRRRHDARGWGFTLKGDNDWKLHKFHHDAPVRTNFRTHYGVDNTGDIYVSDNIRSFASVTDQATNGVGLDLITADGGFSVDGDENFQEEKLRQLVLGQFLTALCVLREGGSFVCKIFDVFTPVTAALVYILYRNFREISICKPYTSRPANSERYVVAKGLLQRKPPVISKLFEVNETFNQLKTSNPPVDLLSFIDVDVLTADKTFFAYIRQTNLEIGETQVVALEHIYKYIEDQYLVPVNQEDVRDRCLKEWKLPDNAQRYNDGGSLSQSRPGDSKYLQQRPLSDGGRDYMGSLNKREQEDHMRNRHYQNGGSNSSSPSGYNSGGQGYNQRRPSNIPSGQYRGGDDRQRQYQSPQHQHSRPHYQPSPTMPPTPTTPTQHHASPQPSQQQAPQHQASQPTEIKLKLSLPKAASPAPTATAPEAAPPVKLESTPLAPAPATPAPVVAAAPTMRFSVSTPPPNQPAPLPLKIGISAPEAPKINVKLSASTAAESDAVPKVKINMSLPSLPTVRLTAPPPPPPTLKLNIPTVPEPATDVSPVASKAPAINPIANEFGLGSSPFPSSLGPSSSTSPTATTPTSIAVKRKAPGALGTPTSTQPPRPSSSGNSGSTRSPEELAELLKKRKVEK